MAEQSQAKQKTAVAGEHARGRESRSIAISSTIIPHPINRFAATLAAPTMPMAAAAAQQRLYMQQLCQVFPLSSQLSPLATPFTIDTF